VSGWRDIESAPERGSMLVSCGNAIWHVARFGDRWMIEHDSDGAELHHHGVKPRYWQPLPELPPA
jgi:hypothetical protein